jgi:hypothetical protein
MDELTEEQQQFLDELNDFTRNVVLRMDIPGQKQFLDSAMAAVQETTPTTIAPGDPTTTTIAPATQQPQPLLVQQQTYRYQHTRVVTHPWIQTIFNQR